MELKEKCTEVMQRNGWTQRQLAQALQISPENLSHAKEGRRPLPAHALAQLERLRGTDDRSIVDQIIRTAGCVALVVVSLILPPSPANAAQTHGKAPVTLCIMSTWVRVRAWMRRAVEGVFRPRLRMG